MFGLWPPEPQFQVFMLGKITLVFIFEFEYDSESKSSQIKKSYLPTIDLQTAITLSNSFAA